MRDHDEVFRRVMKAKEQYEQQKKEKSMFRFFRSAPRGDALCEKEGQKEPSKLFVWAMRAVAVLVWAVMIGGIAAAVYFGTKDKNTKGRSVGENGETPTETVSNTPTDTVTGPPIEGSGVLTMWCVAVEGSYDREAYEQAIAEMRERYPNIDFRWETYFEDEYKDLLKEAVQEGTAPDIFYAWTGYSFDDLIELGQVYCLDEIYENYEDVLPKARCGNTVYNGKQYGAPYMLTADVLFVNMDVLRSAGINEAPSSYNELIACCDTLTGQGIVPFGCAAGEGQEWCIAQFIEQLIIKNAGASALDAVFRGNASWQNPRIAEAVDLYEEFVRNGYFSPADGAETRDDGSVKEDFMDGRYAFYLSGSWDCAALSDCDSDIDAIAFPVINSANADASQFLCGSTGALAVNNDSSKKETAAQYAMELSRLISKYAYLSGIGLPMWKADYDTSGVDELTVRLTQMTQQARSFVLFSGNTMEMNTLMTYLGLVRRVYNGEISGSGFTAAMEATRSQ